MKPVDIDIDAKHKAVQGEKRMIEGEEEEGRGSGVSVAHVYHKSVRRSTTQFSRCEGVARCPLHAARCNPMTCAFFHG